MGNMDLAGTSLTGPLSPYSSTETLRSLWWCSPNRPLPVESTSGKHEIFAIVPALAWWALLLWKCQNNVVSQRHDPTLLAAAGWKGLLASVSEENLCWGGNGHLVLEIPEYLSERREKRKNEWSHDVTYRRVSYFTLWTDIGTRAAKSRRLFERLQFAGKHTAQSCMTGHP